MPGRGSSPTVTSTDPAGDTSLDGEVDEARRILSRDESQRPDAVTVVRAERVEWPDSSYGCPLNDVSYAPGPFTGYRIVLEAMGQDYVYTGAEGTAPRRCLFLD